MQTKIYALTEVDGEIRYIGKTSGKLEQRLYKHLTEAHNIKEKSYKNNWIRSMLNKGCIPPITLVGEVEGNGNVAEISWIAYGRDEFWRLTNGTLGGDGGRHTEETKKKIGLSNLGKNLGKHPTEATKEKIRLSQLGNKHSLGFKHSEATIEKNRLCHLGNKNLLGKHFSEETKLKMSLSHYGSKNQFYGKHHTEESLSKMRQKIIQLDKNGNFIKKFNSLTEAQNITGISLRHISDVCHGRHKTAGGYKWIFDNNNNNLPNLDEKKTLVSQGLFY